MWPIIEQAARRGDTYYVRSLLAEADDQDMWLAGRVVVAVDGPRVLGTSSMYAYRQGPGSHIASGSFMVDEGARGLGVGRALVRSLVDWSRAQGYAGVQFNAVAASNKPAVGLYESLSFVGTVPGAFLHPIEGPVGLHIMFNNLA